MMSYKTTVNDLIERYTALGLQKQQKLVDEYLDKITLLQEQLNLEEKKLLQMVQCYGVDILPS